eukprot:5774271-Amphidinium_carterae.1
MPPEWDTMVARALAYFRMRNIQCQDGTFMWHNLQWGTSQMVSTGGNAINKERLRLIKESPEYDAAFNKYSAVVRERHEQRKAMRNARRSGSMDPAVFFTRDEFETYKRLKQETADFSWHLQVRCEEEAEKLAATRSAEALKLLMISAVESEELQDFFIRCYAMAIEESVRKNTRIIAPGRLQTERFSNKKNRGPGNP